MKQEVIEKIVLRLVCVACGTMAMESSGNPIAMPSSYGRTTTSVGATITQSLAPTHRTTTTPPSSAAVRWIEDTATMPSRGIGVNALEPVSGRRVLARKTVRIPDPMKDTKENAEAVEGYADRLQELYEEMRKIDDELVTKYEASGAEEHVLFLCLPMDKTFLGFKTGRKVAVKRYSCGDGKGLWRVPNYVKDPDVGVFAWVDVLRHRYHMPGDNISFDGRKAIVLYAVYSR